MYLFLDPRSQSEIIVGMWHGKGKPRFLTYHRERETSLLGFVIKRFKPQTSNLKPFLGVVVIPGPGGFSTVRTAALFANIMNFASDIPMLAVKTKAGESLADAFLRGVKLLEQGKRSSDIQPIYSAAPNISVARKV